MNNNQPQLNPGTYTSRLVIEALNAAFVGSTDTAILRFDGTPQLSGIGLSAATTAENGTIITVERPGVYQVQLRGGNGGGTGVAAGVSLNTDAPGLTALPSFAVQGMEDFVEPGGDDAGGNPSAIQLTGIIAVDGAAITAGIAAGGQGALLRAHANQSGGGAPAGLLVGTMHLSISRLNSLF